MGDSGTDDGKNENSHGVYSYRGRSDAALWLVLGRVPSRGVSVFLRIAKYPSTSTMTGGSVWHPNVPLIEFDVTVAGIGFLSTRRGILQTTVCTDLTWFSER